MISDTTRDKWKTKIKTVLEAVLEVTEVCRIELNDWEVDFMESIHNQVIYQNKDLTWKQSQSLNKIYERIT